MCVCVCERANVWPNFVRWAKQGYRMTSTKAISVFVWQPVCRLILIVYYFIPFLNHQSVSCSIQIPKIGIPSRLTQPVRLFWFGLNDCSIGLNVLSVLLFALMFAAHAIEQSRYRSGSFSQLYGFNFSTLGFLNVEAL